MVAGGCRERDEVRRAGLWWLGGWVDGLDRVTDGAEWECKAPDTRRLKQHVCPYSGCLRENSSPCSLWNADDARVRGIVE